MSTTIPELIWLQFGASLDMLVNAVNACPDDQWNGSDYWYLAYHVTFWTDYYLSDTPLEKDFQPPHPFTLSEFQDGQRPERVYNKSEILAFIQHCRQRLQFLLQKATVEYLLETRFVSEYKDYSLFELVLYNVRHVQHHTAQLNMLLRQAGGLPPDWVSRTKAAL